MLLDIRARLLYRLHAPADVLMAVEVAQGADQRLIRDRLTVWGTGPLGPVPGEDGVGRRTWARAEGLFEAEYMATVAVERAVPELARLRAMALASLPPLAVSYLWPSRYCESDRFAAWVRRRFPQTGGGEKVAAMADWVASRMRYVPGASSGRTTAAETFVQREGVCRDYAHLLIAMVRAADIPARIVGAYGYGVHPPDFHAVVEVWLEDGWHLIDPTGLAPVEGIVRICVGRDATDVAFLTLFGTGDLVEQSVTVGLAEEAGPA